MFPLWNSMLLLNFVSQSYSKFVTKFHNVFISGWNSVLLFFVSLSFTNLPVGRQGFPQTSLPVYVPYGMQAGFLNEYFHFVERCASVVLRCVTLFLSILYCCPNWAIIPFGHELKILAHDFYFRGFAPDPTYFLVLKQESKQRNSRLRPPHSKNYAMWAKKSKLALPYGQCFKQQIFLNAHCACFSARRTRPI